MASPLTRGEAALPAVTVVMPVYNESASIDESLGAILVQDYPRERLEILIADGRSEDRTRDQVERVIAAHPRRRIRLLDNPLRTPGAALNRMIREADGEILVRVDGHSQIAPDYVRRCVEALTRTDAVNVGGYFTTSGSGFMGGAIAAAAGSFWGNGGARYRRPPEPQRAYVDTVPFGAWRRETFHRLGLFVEEWKVNEDCEFNARIRDAGGRILLDPQIRVTYHPRQSLRSLARQYFQYGKLKSRVIARHPRQLRARQAAPPAFVLTMLGIFLADALTDTDPSPFIVASAGYVLTLACASAWAAFRTGQARYALALPTVFATMHVSYGLGALVGAVGLLVEAVRTRFRSLRPSTRRSGDDELQGLTLAVPWGPKDRRRPGRRDSLR